MTKSNCVLPEERRLPPAFPAGDSPAAQTPQARGARRIVLGLGGSATNDGGCGCAAALLLQALMGKRRPPRLPHHCSPQADWIRLLSSAENSIALARMLAWERANFWWPKPMNPMRRF